MFLPRADPTVQPTTPTPTPTASPSTHNGKSANVVTFVIVVLAIIAGLACFYMLYWRRRPSPHPKTQLVISRTGQAYLRTHYPSGTRTERRERQRIIEQVQREQESCRECEANAGVRRVEEGPEGGVNPPKYSRAADDIQVSEREAAEALAQTTIRVPPPAYNPSETRSPC